MQVGERMRVDGKEKQKQFTIKEEWLWIEQKKHTHNIKIKCIHKTHIFHFYPMQNWFVIENKMTNRQQQ